MSNFSLQPSAVECKTLTKNAIDQGAQWSLVGSTRGHANPGDKAGSSRSFSLAWWSDIYTAELSELYAVCLARALVGTKLTAYKRNAVIRDSELCRKMARVSLSKQSRRSVKRLWFPRETRRCRYDAANKKTISRTVAGPSEHAPLPLRCR
jgi:hypothetical protein